MWLRRPLEVHSAYRVAERADGEPQRDAYHEYRQPARLGQDDLSVWVSA
jgi:hypothetical protein